jgi:polyhydroxybutyrate depolymerase
MRKRIALAFVCFAACGGSDDPADRPVVFGGDRPVQLQVPSDFDESHSYPLVMILHGYGVSGSVQQSFLHLGTLADDEDALVLAPDGTIDSTNKPFWNAGSAWCNTVGCPDDVGYLGGLIDDVSAAWPVDASRVQLVGHSNGAFMAYRMTCDRADVVTAIAGLAGLGPIDPCMPTGPVHVLHIHGTLDAVVPYDGGDWGGVNVPGAVESVAQAAARNGCAGGTTAGTAKDLDREIAGSETAVATTNGCPADGAAELWTIEGSSHVPPFTDAFVPELIAWIDAHARAR